jgi:integrase/recombinase XerD
MGLKKQAKTLSNAQIKTILTHIQSTRFPNRNRVIFLLSIRAGLRAKEIAHLKWSMLTDPEGNLLECIHLQDQASKGRSGRIIPMAKDLKQSILELRQASNQSDTYLITTQRSGQTSAQVIVNLFRDWFLSLGFEGASSHSGRRTVITQWARRIGSVGGSLKDVQMLAGHASLTTTQRYIEVHEQAQRKVVDWG